MCPNCFPSNQAFIDPGYIIAFFICILFFVVAAGAMWLAGRSGHMSNLEESKYSMLED